MYYHIKYYLLLSNNNNNNNMMWDLTLDWYSRVYSCVNMGDHYKCKRFMSAEAANIYKSYTVGSMSSLIYICYFTPLLLDSTILKIKLGALPLQPRRVILEVD